MEQLNINSQNFTQFTHLAFLKSIAYKEVSFWNKIINFDFYEVRGTDSNRIYNLPHLTFDIELSDPTLLNNKENKDYIFLLNDKEEVFYLPILKISKKEYNFGRHHILKYGLIIENSIKIDKTNEFIFMKKPPIKIVVSNKKTYPAKIDLLTNKAYTSHDTELTKSEDNLFDEYSLVYSDVHETIILNDKFNFNNS